VLALAAAAEVSSEHPVAAAVLAFAESAIGPAESATGPAAVADGGGGGLEGSDDSGNIGSDVGSRRRLERQASHGGGGSRDVGWVAPSSGLEVLPGRCGTGSPEVVFLHHEASS